jgi:hypothetical protein
MALACGQAPAYCCPQEVGTTTYVPVKSRDNEDNDARKEATYRSGN